MAEFEPAEFLEIDVTRTWLAKLDKAKLWKLMEYLELDAAEEAKKPELLQCILVTCNPEEENKERERQQKELEREEREREGTWEDKTQLGES